MARLHCLSLTHAVGKANRPARNGLIRLRGRRHDPTRISVSMCCPLATSGT